MCANATPTDLQMPLPSTSSSRSLFSRLTSPLKSRARNLTEFHIRPDEPHRQYSPGDLVRGAVVLTVVKPIRITHLTVCLHGLVRVFKHANGANESLPDPSLLATSNTRRTQYFGNGHASLFQDEQTLCGEGRLEAAEYQFNFELEFPSTDLPTSIDFERGTIAYMITATMTRPTSIATTSSCDRKISLVETVDIGPMPPPKPRVISLEPISRKSRKKKAVKSKDSQPQDNTDAGSISETARQAGSPLPEESASQCGSIDHQATPRSPVPSEVQSTVSTATSADSTGSASTGPSFRLGAVPSTAKSTKSTKHSKNDSKNGSNSPFEEQTITATIELLKSGCLPGDNLPLKISIKHTKPIKSLHGVIVTLYRQGRIDSSPPLSLFSDTKGKEAERLKHEEYYPKSKTGLGGLSLSSTGSCSMFRKDLAQTFAPILVDPYTLSAVIHASVRVPEDAFPTISGVPGQMISFKYHVEVIVDLGGKLASQQRRLPRMSTVAVSSNYGNSSAIRGGGNPNILTAYGGSIVETDHIRREKGVISPVFEITVGTVDSARKRDRGHSSVKREISDWNEETSATPVTLHEPLYEESFHPYEKGQNYEKQQQPYPYYEQPYNNQNLEYYPDEAYDYQEFYPEQGPPPAHSHISIPPPDIQAEEGLGEKERVRRAEERLLPSQPPTDILGAPSSSAVVHPSAPPTEPVEDLYGAEDADHSTVSNVFHSSGHTVSAETPFAPSAPVLEDLTPTATQVTEDKQELERRRLLAEASAPSGPPDDEEDNAGESSSAPHFEPSAPILSDEDEFESQYSHHDFPASLHRDTLPKYER